MTSVSKSSSTITDVPRVIKKQFKYIPTLKSTSLNALFRAHNMGIIPTLIFVFLESTKTYMWSKYTTLCVKHLCKSKKKKKCSIKRTNRNYTNEVNLKQAAFRSSSEKKKKKKKKSPNIWSIFSLQKALKPFWGFNRILIHNNHILSTCWALCSNGLHVA